MPNRRMRKQDVITLFSASGRKADRDSIHEAIREAEAILSRNSLSSAAGGREYLLTPRSFIDLASGLPMTLDDATPYIEVVPGSHDVPIASYARAGLLPVLPCGIREHRLDIRSLC